jgi:protein TonB
MKRLTDQRIAELNRYLTESGLSKALLPELLDHLACEAEERLWAGMSMEEVIGSLLSEVDSDILRNLNIERNHLLTMETSLNDIIFENRNKQYGAYALRTEYGGTIQRATLLGVGVFLLLFLLPELYAHLKPTPDKDDIAFLVEARIFSVRPEEIPLPPKEMKTPPPVVKTVRSLPPIVVPDEEVLEEHQPPTVEMLNNAQSSLETIEGEAMMELVVPPVDGRIGGKEKAIEVKPEEEKTLLFAEQQPEFNGGMEAFSKFLQKNLKYPSTAARAGVEGKVFVEFTVGTDGAIQGAKVVKGIGFGCDEEALRVITLMPNWNPGKQSGRPVRVRFTLPISFQLD